MRKIVVVSAFLLALVAVILASLSSYINAFIPGVLALMLGFYGRHISKTAIKHAKTAELAIILASLAIVLAAVKFFVLPPETDTPVQPQQEEVAPEEEDLDLLQEQDSIINTEEQ